MAANRNPWIFAPLLLVVAGAAVATELPRLAAGHFAVEDNLDLIASNMIRLYDGQVAQHR
jgi:hypothetical protein